MEQCNLCHQPIEQWHGTTKKPVCADCTMLVVFTCIRCGSEFPSPYQTVFCPDCKSGKTPR